MANTVISASLKLDGKEANKSVKSFKQELREANEDLIKIQGQFGATSKEALAAAKRVADLRDSVQEAKEVSDLFDPGAKFQVFGNVLRTVAGGFSALTGTMAIFGSQSEDVEKALLKVQGALALTEGLNTIVDSAKDFDRLKAVLSQTSAVQKTLATSTALTSGAFKAAGVSVNATSTSFKVLRGAIIATGIGALVVGVGLLISNFDKVKKVVLNLVPGLASVGEFIGKIVNNVTDFVGATSEAERAMDKLQRTTKRGNEDIEGRIKLLTAQGGKEAEIAKLRQQQADNELKFLREKLKTTGALTEEEQKQFRDLKDQKIIIAEEEKRRLAELDKKANEEADAKAKQAAEKAKAAREKRLAELKQKLEDEKQYQAEVEKMIAESTSRLNEIDAEKKQKDKDLFNQRIANTRDSLQAQMSVLNEIQFLQKDSIAQQQEDELHNLGEWYKERFAVVKGNATAEALLLEEVERQKAAIEYNSQMQRLQVAGEFLQKGADLLGKQTLAGKALAISAATINTYVAASDALKANYGMFGPFAQVARFAAVATTIATGLKNVREIAKTQVPGGGSAAAPMPTIDATAPLTPSPQVAQTSTILDQKSINEMSYSQEKEIVAKAYIVESDVANSVERKARIERAARLG